MRTKVDLPFCFCAVEFDGQEMLGGWVEGEESEIRHAARDGVRGEIRAEEVKAGNLFEAGGVFEGLTALRRGLIGAAAGWKAEPEGFGGEGVGGHVDDQIRHGRRPVGPGSKG